MKLTKLTMLFSGIILFLIIAFDVWTLVVNGYQTTISANMYEFAVGIPVIPFALGIVCGHLFWPNKAASALAKAKEP